MANEQEIGKLIIRLSAELSDIKKQFDVARKELKQTSDDANKNLSSISKNIEEFKTAYVVAAAKIYAAYKILRTAFEFAEMGANAQQTEEAFRTLTNSIGVDGEKLIRKMKEVSGVWVDETGIMIKAQRLLVEKVSPEDIVGLVESSRVAARLMGTSVMEAFDKISEAAITLRTRGLKAAFPMDVQEVTENYARSLGTVSKYLNEAGQRQAIVNEILRQGAEKTKLLGNELHPSLSEKFQKLRSAIEEFKEIAGKSIASFMESTLEWMDKLIPKTETFKNIILGMTLQFQSYIPIVGTLLQKITLDTIKKQEDATKKAEGLQTSESRFMKRYQDQQKKDDKTNFIDKRKLDEDSTRFRLQAEEQRITATGQMRALALQNERAGAIAAAKLTSENTFLIEQRFDRKLAEESLRSALEVLNVKQKAELAETVKTGMSAAVINQKYLDERLLAYQKFSTDVGKLDAERQTMINEAHRKAVFLQFGFLAEGELPEVPTPAPTGRQQGEADARSRARDLDRQRRIEDWRSQLVEVSNDYDSITASQVKSLEEQRRIYLLTEEGMLLWGEELEAYNKLTDAKVAEIKVTRELNKEQNLVKLRQQVFELQGSWTGMKNAEIEALEIEKQITLATDKLTDSQRELIEQVYTLRKAEVQAAKDMNVSELMKIGMKEMSIKANRDLADTFKNILPDSIHSFGNTFREFLKTGVMDFKSFGESLRDIWANVLTKMAEKWLTDFLEKTVMGGGGGGGGFGGIIGFIESLFGGGGEKNPVFSGLGLGIFKEGGGVSGMSGQPVPAMLHAKEFVQPESSVSYYGSGVMEAIRRQIIPRGLLQGFFSGRPLTPSFAFQTGGLVEPNISRSISSLVKVEMGNKWNEAKLQDSIEKVVVKVLKDFI